MPSGAMPVAGSMPAVPEQNTNPLATIAWLYGPIAGGALSVDTACRVIGALLRAGVDGRLPARLVHDVERCLGDPPETTESRIRDDPADRLLAGLGAESVAPRLGERVGYAEECGERV